VSVFLTVMLYILWCVLILVAIIGGATWLIEGSNRPAASSVLVAGLVLLGMLLATMVESGAFEDHIPPDGCYQLYRTKQVTPAGQGQVVITDDVHFQEIPCP